ncbi:hypothetical protein GPALN_014574 [Globodera pallida]|nr:hypothetical protein GPALN_014574 [Globodera pallida]
MNSPTANDASFEIVTENGEMDTLAAERGKGHNIGEKEEEKGVNDREAQTKADKLEQKNAAALQQADAVALEHPFDAHKVLQQTLLKLEEYQNEQRQNQKEICVQIGELKKLVGPGAGTFCLATELITQVDSTLWQFNLCLLTPQNRWDIAACSKEFTLVEPERLIAKRYGNYCDHDGGSVFSERPIPKKDFGIFYFEMKITKSTVFVPLYIGLATKQMPLDGCMVGPYKGTYAYSRWGDFWGHEVEGCHQGSSGAPFIIGNHWFGAGSVVGCGLNLATRQIIYTRNGKRLDTANLFVDSAAADLFPCLSCACLCNEIEANFGPNFKFDIADGI